MRLEQFEQFIALGRFRHFRQAAEQCKLSTSALTRSIQTLEQDLNCELVTRSTRSVSLTEAGEVFLQYCQQCLDSHQMLVQKLQRFSRSNLEKITVGYCMDATAIVPQACGKFMQQYPQISIEMQLQEQSMLSDKIKTGNIDLAIGANDNQQSASQGIQLPDQLIMFCHKDHPLALKQSVEHNDLLAFPLLACMSNSAKVVSMIEDVATSLNKHANFKLGNFEQVLHGANDKQHLALCGIEHATELESLNDYLVLKPSLNHSSLNLAMQVSKSLVSEPSINQLLSFIMQEAHSQPKINLEQYTI